MILVAFIIWVLISIIWVLIMRAFGAWMLRINDVINKQEETNTLLREMKDLLNKK